MMYRWYTCYFVVYAMLFSIYFISKEHDRTVLYYFQAPEMFCSTTYDASVDLWSVGVILYGKNK